MTGWPVEWVPSDEADVFRLTFSSELEPRYLKLPIQGTGVVRREVAMLPALRARGFPVLEFEYRTSDLPDAGIEFHITREVEHVAGADLVAGDPSVGHRLATQLGRVVRRLEGLDARMIPGSLRWNRRRSEWWRPQYRALIGDRAGRPRLARGPSASWGGWTRRGIEWPGSVCLITYGAPG